MNTSDEDVGGNNSVSGEKLEAIFFQDQNGTRWVYSEEACSILPQLPTEKNNLDFYKKELHKWQAIAAERLERIIRLREYLNSDGYHSSSYDETCPVCKLLEETKEDA